MTPVKILGFEFTLPTPYEAGHVLSAAEAATLNRLLVKGLSKGLYKVLLASLPSGHERADGLTEEQRSWAIARGAQYVTDYVLGFQRGHDTTRAERVEAERIARQMLETSLYRQGKKLTDLGESERKEQIEQLAATDKVRTEAERRVRVTQEIAERAHDELLVALSNGGEKDVS